MRYLIVLDDVWSIEAWETIRLFFPDNGNRSRIIVTTRLSYVTTHFGNLSFPLTFLDEDKSWELLCKKTFVQASCAPELEGIGKEIAEKRKGLPLSISVVGGLLKNSSMTREYWENVSDNIISILNSGEDSQSLNILYLSYSQMPVYLKPCFLYMGVFPEDDEIQVSGLLQLWIAEGFLKPNKSQSLEEIAEEYLHDLIDRNLVLVCKLGSTGKIKSCIIHDLVRDLCSRIATKEEFLCVKRRGIDIPRDIERERRILLHKNIPNKYFHHLQSASPCLRFSDVLL